MNLAQNFFFFLALTIKGVNAKANPDFKGKVENETDIEGNRQIKQ